MRDLQKYANECLNDMKALGIEIPHIENFTINTRAKQRFGQCRKRKNKFYININVNLLNEECPISSLKETLYHEIIHTLPNCMNHGAEFKRYANMVNKAYGVNVTRCSSYEEKYGEEYGKKVADSVKTTRIYNSYELICPSCDRIIAKGMYQRSPKWYSHPEYYKCTRCGCKSLERNGIIRNV